MILEGLVTTSAADGALHVAALGPWVDERERHAGRIGRLVLRPFATSQSAANLARVPAGVFHVTDDVLLLARVVAGVGPPPPARPARVVPGHVLDDCCAAYEFEVTAGDAGAARHELHARVVHVHEGRPFLGFNRAAHAVVEGAILVTRLHLLEAAEVRRRLDELAPLVEKTGGTREREAFAIVCARAGGRPAPA